MITPESILDDLNVFYGIYPYRNIGIIINQFLVDFFPAREVLDGAFADKAATYTLIPVKDPENIDINEKLDNLDAVYIGGFISLSDERIAKLAADINARNLPCFSSLWESGAETGFLVNHSSSYQTEHFFRRIALIIEGHRHRQKSQRHTHPHPLFQKTDF